MMKEEVWLFPNTRFHQTELIRVCSTIFFPKIVNLILKKIQFKHTLNIINIHTSHSNNVIDGN